MAKKKGTKAMTASMMFDIPCDEQTAEFFKRMYDEHVAQEQAATNRIRQLFDEFIGVVDKTTDQNAYAQVLKVFSIGYQLGWNDQHNIAKMERTININGN